MQNILSKPEYERKLAETRDSRMEWFRAARFGMFVHYGLFSQLGRNEWEMLIENYTIPEYEKLADTFSPKPGAPREWAKLASEGGMKYIVMTTRHHEGFSLWDSKVNPYNSVNYGPKRDIVCEFVDACREYGLKIGFYSSLMDWHHPDGYTCAYDNEARHRFNNYIYELNRELLTNYGKIDILWYDVPRPMESWEGWNSLEMNQKLRELQPHIIINNRSKLDEDFGTPEGRITPMDRDWEACMTFNDISWGYLDPELARPYSYTAHRILRMINTVTNGKGNLLLNIGPKPDGSVPDEAVEPLQTLGKWLKENGEAVYGKTDVSSILCCGATGSSCKDNVLYLWDWIWHKNGEMTLGGFFTKLKSAKFVSGDNNTPIEFVQDGARIFLKNLPKESPDKFMNVPVIALEFKEKPECVRGSRFPQIHGGYLRDENF